MHIDQLFSQVQQQISSAQLHASLSAPVNWAQGRTLYGGISASLVYCGMRQLVAPEKVLRALNTSFIGPIEPDVPFRIELTILREGKNTSQLEGKIIQHGQVCLAALASFGLERKSAVKVANSRQHNMPAPKKANFLPMIPKVTPKFMGHFELAKEHGSFPFTGSKSSDLGGWMRFKQAPAVFTDAHLVAIIDMWPPTVLQLLRWPAPASTMCWNLEFIHPHREFAADGWLAYHAHTLQADSGYAHTEANIWDGQGALVAISRQTVTVFD